LYESAGWLKKSAPAVAFGFWGILSPVWVLLLLSTMLPVLVTVIEDEGLYKSWRIVKLRHAC
jgi:hypothetical protein